jgi:hypothetical protein
MTHPRFEFGDFRVVAGFVDPIFLFRLTLALEEKNPKKRYYFKLSEIFTLRMHFWISGKCCMGCWKSNLHECVKKSGNICDHDDDFFLPALTSLALFCRRWKYGVVWY